MDSDKHDHLIKVPIRILLDEMEPIFLVIADELISTIKTDHPATDDLLSSPYPIKSLIDQDLAESFESLSPRKLSEKICLCDPLF